MTSIFTWSSRRAANREDSVFNDVVLETGFENKIGFLEDTRRSRIVCEGFGVNPAKRKIGKAETCEGTDRLAHDALVPESLAEPVTQFGSVPMHIMPYSNAYTAHSLAVDVDTKKRCRLFACRSP